MLKKYFFISTLIGSFVLLGCQDDVANNKELTEETLTSEQSIVNNNENVTTKKENLSPVLLNLTQEQKEEYYQEYVSILEKVNKLFSDSPELKLEPITEFLDEYWIKIDDFEKLAKERKNMSILVLENRERYNPMSVPKTVKFLMGSQETNVIFKGSFDTQLNSNTSKGRQEFSAFNSISSEAVDGEGSWTQLGFNELLADNGITYVIDVGGEFSQLGIISTHTMALKFNCDENGGIS